MFPAPAKADFFTASGSVSGLGSPIQAVDVSGWGVISLQISGTFAATVSFECSNDGLTWFSCLMGPTSAATGMVSTASATGVFSAPCAFRFFRARCSSWTSGTINASLLVTRSPVASDNISGAVAQSGTWTMQPGNTANTTPWLVTTRPAATGSTLAKHRLIAAATTNATSVKASAGQVYTIHVYNLSAAVKFLKLYNKATAPTVGTDTPVETHAIPAANWVRIDYTNHGNPFATGIGYALTGGGADSDTTALLAAGDVVLNMLYV